MQEPVVEAVDRQLHNMTATELLAVIWDEPELRPLSPRLLPYSGARSGKDFVFALARAAVVRQLAPAFNLTANTRRF